MRRVAYYKEFSSIVTWKVPVYEDGTVGRPEPSKMFTTEPKKRGVKKQQKPLTPVREDTIEL